jgi:hypothetical protein
LETLTRRPPHTKRSAETSAETNAKKNLAKKMIKLERRDKERRDKGCN